ncbi:MAG: hypothetical protein AABZ30_01105 [Myxococcota bacterium]
MRLARSTAALFAYAAASAQASPLVGLVESVESRWAGGRIVSHVRVRPDAGGALVDVRVMGGRVGRIGMRVFDVPEVAPGERAALWLEGGWIRAKARLAGGRRAYVRAQTTVSGAPLAWSGATQCMTVAPDAAGSADVADESEIDALASAAETWRAASEKCGYARVIVTEPRAGLRAEYTNDGVNENVVVWEETQWGRPDEGVSYPAGATGLTTLFFIDDPSDAEDGRILDADIELNGVDWTFTTRACEPGARQADVENTLAHELGHLLGLDHTCDTGRGEAGGQPLDDSGLPLPACDAAPPEIRATTMFGVAGDCETEKRTPEPDDILGLCAIYPLAADPGVCGPDPGLGGGDDPGGCACAVSSRSGVTYSPVYLAALLFAARRRRGRLRRAACGTAWGLRAPACSPARRPSGCGAAASGPPRASGAA